MLELAAWMDIAENFSTVDPELPYRIAAQYFSHHRLRQAEAAVIERFESRQHQELQYLSHSIQALRRRGHTPNALAARFHLRGEAPTGDPVDLPSTVPNVSAAQLEMAVAFLEECGERRLNTLNEPGTLVSLRNANVVVYIHPGMEKLRRKTLEKVHSSQINHWRIELVCFASGEVTENAIDYGAVSGISIFSLDLEGAPQPLNFDAELFLGRRTPAQPLFTTDMNLELPASEQVSPISQASTAQLNTDVCPDIDAAGPRSEATYNLSEWHAAEADALSGRNQAIDFNSANTDVRRPNWSRIALSIAGGLLVLVVLFDWFFG